MRSAKIRPHLQFPLITFPGWLNRPQRADGPTGQHGYYPSNASRCLAWGVWNYPLWSRYFHVPLKRLKREHSWSS
ncbi:MAG: hypothetical protein ACI91F_002984 [Candidatus Binatia bacterium]